MRLQILSDLHADIRPATFTPAPDVDAIVVAGDVCEGVREGFALLRRIVGTALPIVTVCGNHEFYEHSIDGERAAARDHCARYGIRFLDDDVATIGALRFVGATLWTDYALFGVERRGQAMRDAAAGMNDHCRIALAGSPRSPFRPEDALALHRQSRRFLEGALEQSHDGPTIVVTHHAPHGRSIEPAFRGDRLNPCYASDLTETIAAGRPALWVHGHVHASADYEVGGTRVVCNPHGYGSQNPSFDPGMVIDV